MTPLTGLTWARLVSLALLLSAMLTHQHRTPADLALFAGAAAWAAGAGAAYFLSTPAWRFWRLWISLGDCLFAIMLAAAGVMLAPLVLTALIGLFRVSFGDRLKNQLPLCGALFLVCMALFLVRRVEGLPLVETPADIALHLALMVIGGATAGRFFWLRFKLHQLETGYEFTELFSIDLPFAFKLDSWLKQLSVIFGGGHAGLCAIVLEDSEGLGRIHSNKDDNHLSQVDAVPLLRLAPSIEPVLKPLADHAAAVTGDERHRNAFANAVRLFAHQMGAAGEQDNLLLRSLSIGRMRGVVIITHTMRDDRALETLCAAVDQALGVMLRKLRNTLETRRQFLAEAREISRRDLHDGVLQTLAALRMRLSTSARDAMQVDDALANDLRRTSEIVSLEQARLRALLDSGVERDQPVNLIDTLKLCLRTISLQWEIEARMVTEEMAIPTDRETAENIEHLVREIVANASRHSESRKVDLGIAMREDMLVLSLQDYGKSRTKMERGARGNPMASRSLKHRLALVNGEAYWEDVAKGSLLAINIPLVKDIELE